MHSIPTENDEPPAFEPDDSAMEPSHAEGAARPAEAAETVDAITSSHTFRAEAPMNLSATDQLDAATHAPNHPGASDTPSNSEDQSESPRPECIICTKPMPWIFATLPNCDHCFCLHCIKTWRRAGGLNKRKADVADNTKRCPTCRAEAWNM